MNVNWRSGRPTRHQVGPTTEPYVRVSRIRLFGKSLITAGGATEILLDATVKAAIAACLEIGSCPRQLWVRQGCPPRSAVPISSFATSSFRHALRSPVITRLTANTTWSEFPLPFQFGLRRPAVHFMRTNNGTSQVHERALANMPEPAPPVAEDRLAFDVRRSSAFPALCIGSATTT
jgi:hypothetical protein